MVDTQDVDGLDPYDMMESETARLDAFFAGLDDTGFARPSRAEGWSVRDMLAHFMSSEDYNRACLDGTVNDFLAQLGARGATDLASANEIGIRDLDAVPNAELLDRWRASGAANLRDLRARDGDDIDTSVGPYPARWQAFHLAFELAIHAGDIDVPVATADESTRTASLGRVARFLLREAKPDATIGAGLGTTRVRGPDVDIELPDAEFVAATVGRQPGLDPAVRDYLLVMS
jgi:uncharacterized protein (TIGR03083 family)